MYIEINPYAFKKWSMRLLDDELIKIWHEEKQYWVKAVYEPAFNPKKYEYGAIIELLQ